MANTTSAQAHTSGTTVETPVGANGPKPLEQAPKVTVAEPTGKVGIGEVPIEKVKDKVDDRLKVRIKGYKGDGVDAEPQYEYANENAEEKK